MFNKGQGVNSAFSVFCDGLKIDGVVSVTTPEKNQLTIDLQASGVAGTVQVPLRGKYESMEFGLKINNPGFNNLLEKTGYINFTVKTNIVSFNNLTGQPVDDQQVYKMKCIFKSATGGEIVAGEKYEREYKYEAVSLTELTNGIEKFHLDKMNNVYRIGGIPVNSMEKTNIGEF